MRDFISEKQFAQNISKFGFQTYDKNVHNKVNDILYTVVKKQLRQNNSSKTQKGGRVSFPLEYFGTATNNYSANMPSFTNLTSTETFIRSPMLLHDPTNVLGTPKGMTSGMPSGMTSEMTSGMIGGGRTQNKFKVTNSAIKDVVKDISHTQYKKKSVQNDPELLQNSKQKFESVMNEMLHKVSHSSKQHHLSEKDFKQVLQLKKYKAFKD